MAKIKTETLANKITVPTNFIENLKKELSKKSIKIVSAEKLKKNILKGKPTDNYSLLLSNDGKLEIRVYVKDSKVATVFYNGVEVLGGHQSIMSPKFKDGKLEVSIANYIQKHESVSKADNANIGDVKVMDKKELNATIADLEAEIENLKKELETLKGGK
jgi:uncharacterized small protein (DUF1192 family)